jgi:hypothetical protein
MKKTFTLFVIFCLSSQLSIAQHEGYSSDSWKNQLDFEQMFANHIDKTSFKKHLKKLTERPHVVGSEANEEVIRYIGEVMDKAGLDVTNYPYDVYLPNKPGSSLIEIVTPSRDVLNQKEDIIPNDPFSDDPLLWKGWNAFSGSGDITAEVVYANYGRKEDFEKLKSLGVDVSGKIVLARYGGNFRGFKAKFAEANGAAGLIIFTDPKDSGYTKGLVYPDGPYYNESTIQRGSLLTTDFTGDPLTPFEPSILIGHWDAEEHGVIGSSEWVEQMRDELNAKGVVYMNFDGGVSGKNFGASAAPTLKKLMVESSKVVKYPYTDQSLFEFWKKDNKDEPSIGNLGGGSDHIAFYMHVGVPSLSGGAGGPNLYHSNYDSFSFYEQYVDPEFQMGPMVEHMAGLMALRMANAEIIPYNLNRYAQDLKIHFANAESKINGFDKEFKGFKLTTDAITSLEQISQELTLKIKSNLENKEYSKKELQNLNQQLIALEKSFISDQGMYFGSWYKSLYASSDPFSGYAAWILPGLEYEIALKSSDRLQEWDSRYTNAINSLTLKMKKLIQELK